MDFRNVERPVDGCTPKNMQGGGGAFRMGMRIGGPKSYDRTKTLTLYSLYIIP
jgi:hypothetical protein